MSKLNEILQNCKEAQVIGIEKEFQAIGLNKWVKLKLHTTSCSYCKNFLQQSAQINSIIKKVQQGTLQETLSQEKKEEIALKINVLMEKIKS